MHFIYSNWTPKLLRGILPNKMLSFRMVLCFLVLLSSQVGWSKSFDFNDPKGFNSIEFSLAGAPGKGLVLGEIKEVEGTLEYDPSAPSRTTGKIEALARSAQANAPEANAFLHGPSLFDVKRFPRVTFAFQKVSELRRLGKTSQVEVMGTLTIKGRTQKITIPAEMEYLPGKLKARLGKDGDLLVIRGKFHIKRSDFNLGVGKFNNLAGERVKVELTLVGSAAKKSIPSRVNPPR